MSHDHPSVEVLASFVTGTLSADEATLVERHIESCDRCLAELDDIDRELSDGSRPQPMPIEEQQFQRFYERIKKEGLPSFPSKIHAVMAKAISHAEMPESIGTCKIESELGRGGMGVVYKGIDSANRLVAIKVMSPLGTSEAAMKRFNVEAQAWGRIKHNNIVTQYHFGIDGRLGPFIVMEYVDGITLDAHQRQTRLTPRQIANYMVEVACGVHACHEQNVFHRDLKPSNIMIAPNGIPKVTDFGIAKINEDTAEKLTQDDTTLGTIEYMSPEQVMGRKTSAQSDVYSLGVILFELVTGSPPFLKDSQNSIRDRILKDAPPKPSKLVEKTPKDLEAIILKCLEKNPVDRYESARSLAEDLTRFLEDRPTLAQPVNLAVRLWKWVNRNPHAAGLIAALTCAIITLGYVLVLERRATREAKQAKEDAINANRKTEFEKYAGQIQLAEKAFEGNNLLAVADYLSDTKAEFQNIEWNLLNNLCHQEKHLIGSEHKCVEVSWNPDLSSNEFLSVSNNETAGYVTAWNSQNWVEKSSVSIGASAFVAINWPKNIVAWVGEPPEFKISLVNFRNGAALSELTQRKVNNLSISPDGKWLVGTEGPKGFIWNIESGEVRSEWLGKDVANYRNSLFHPHQNVFVSLASSTSLDEKLVVRELPSGKPIHVLIGHEGERMPNVGCFSPDGSLFISGTYIDPRVAHEEEIAIWDFSVAPPKLIQKNPLHKSGIASIDFHPDGRHAMTSGLDKVAKIIELDPRGIPLNHKIRTLVGHGKFITAKFSNDGQLFATIEADNNLRIWDFKINQGPFRFAGHPRSGVFSVAISPDNHTVATGGSYGLVNIFNLTTGEILHSYCATEDHEDFVVHSLAFSSDGKTIAAGGMGNSYLGRLIDVETSQQIASFPAHIDSPPVFVQSKKASHQNEIRTVAFHPNGHLLFCGGYGPNIHIWNARTGEHVAEWTVLSDEGDSVRQLSFSPDGRLGVVSIYGGARVFDKERGSVCLELPRESSYHCMAFSKDHSGSMLAVASYQFETRILNSVTGEQISVLEGTEDIVTSIDFTKDGKRVITSSNDSGVRIWDVATGKLLLRLTGHPGAVMMAQLTPDERHLITAGWGNTTLIWNVAGTTSEAKKQSLEIE